MEKCTITIADSKNKAVINVTDENGQLKIQIVGDNQIADSDEPSLVAWALVTFMESLTK